MKKLQGAYLAASSSVLSIANWVGGMRHANLLVWRGNLRFWGLTGSVVLHGNLVLLLLLGCPFSKHCGVLRHRGADEFFEGGFVYLLSFAEVDRTPHVSLEAGIKKLLRIF